MDMNHSAACFAFLWLEPSWSGTSYTGDQLAALAEVCRREHVIVVSDEIYEGVTFGDRPHQSMVGTLVPFVLPCLQ